MKTNLPALSPKFLSACHQRQTGLHLARVSLFGVLFLVGAVGAVVAEFHVVPTATGVFIFQHIGQVGHWKFQLQEVLPSGAHPEVFIEKAPLVEVAYGINGLVLLVVGVEFQREDRF